MTTYPPMVNPPVTDPAPQHTPAPTIPDAPQYQQAPPAPPVAEAAIVYVDGVADFTIEHKPIRFRIDGDVFDLIPALPVFTLVEFANLAGSMGDKQDSGEAITAFTQLFQMILRDESAARFVARMRDKEHPVELDQVRAIMPWVLEQFGMRPTEPSSDSSTESATPEAGRS